MDVKQSASQDDIKKSFYKLAKKYHPDVNKGHEERFKLVNEAYETLGNPSRRRDYDQLGSEQREETEYKKQRFYHHYHRHQNNEGHSQEEQRFKHHFQEDLSNFIAQMARKQGQYTSQE